MRRCPGFVPVRVPILWFCMLPQTVLFRRNLTPSQQEQDAHQDRHQVMEKWRNIPGSQTR